MSVWDFLEVFKMNYIFVSDYRNSVIDRIRRDYTVEEFYKHEMALNDMFWNIREMVAKLMGQKLGPALTMCEAVEYGDQLEEILADNYVVMDERYSHYRSFINKLVIVDKSKGIVWLKCMEGSADIFSKNHFNLLTMTILFNRDIYEKFMKDPKGTIDGGIELSKYYFQYDYPFPNLNCCAYLVGTEEDRIDRIKKMYYNNGDKGEYWFRIIY